MMIKFLCRRTSQSRSSSRSRSGSPKAVRQRSEYITEFKASKGRSQAHGSAGSAPHDLSAPKRSVTRLSTLPACKSSSAATLLTRNTAQCCFPKPQSSVADLGFQQPKRLGSNIRQRQKMHILPATQSIISVGLLLLATLCSNQIARSVLCCRQQCQLKLALKQQQSCLGCVSMKLTGLSECLQEPKARD